jgi:hypothetical protein
VHFTADVELRDLIERARAVASHRLPKGDLASLLKLALTTFVQQEEKRRFAIGGKPRKAAGGGKPRAVAAGASRKITQVQVSASQSTLAGSASQSTLGGSATESKHGKVTAERWPGKVTAQSRTGEVAADCSRAQQKCAGSRSDAVEASVFRGCEMPREDETGATSPGEVLAKSKRPCCATSRSGIGKRSRYVSAAVRREVYLRDCGRCSFVSGDGRRCEARAFLELDHVEPWVALGRSEADNLPLRCRAHNGLHAHHCFGALHIAGKIAARRRAAQARREM